MQHPPPLDADGRLEAAIQQAQRAASARADRLPVRLGGSAAPPPALAARIRAAIEPFVGDVIGKMVAICAFLRRVTAWGRFGIRAKSGHKPQRRRHWEVSEKVSPYGQKRPGDRRETGGAGTNWVFSRLISDRGMDFEVGANWRRG